MLPPSFGVSLLPQRHGCAECFSKIPKVAISIPDEHLRVFNVRMLSNKFAFWPKNFPRSVKDSMS